MIDDVISFDYVIGYQAVKQKTALNAKRSTTATRPPLISTLY